MKSVTCFKLNVLFRLLLESRLMKERERERERCDIISNEKSVRLRQNRKLNYLSFKKDKWLLGLMQIPDLSAK